MVYCPGGLGLVSLVGLAGLGGLVGLLGLVGLVSVVGLVGDGRTGCQRSSHYKSMPDQQSSHILTAYVHLDSKLEEQKLTTVPPSFHGDNAMHLQNRVEH